MCELFVLLALLSLPLFPQATQVPAASGSGTVTAGTGILVAGSQVSIDTAVTQKLSVGQSGSPLYCVSASGSATTYTCALNPTLTAYTAGMTLAWKVDTSCTGGTATTINVDALGAKSIKQADGTTDPASGDCPANRQLALRYDGTVFRILGGEVANCCSAGNDGGFYLIYQGYSTNSRVWGQNGGMYCAAFVPSYKFTANQVDLALTGSGTNTAGAALYDNTGALVQSTATRAFAGGAYYGLYFTSTTFNAGQQYYLCVSTNSTNGTDTFTAFNLSSAYASFINTHDNTGTVTTTRLFTCAASSVNWTTPSAPVWPSTLPTRTAAAQDLPVAVFSTH